ncbi:ATP phosphoribosyltransferase regulatory subunit [Nitratireductor kimnyeongensis]|uniref:ATP phosphoribosyltransferase regulatory subunit n=1 Tax=Nitratireductor kimnyeongensis TaxID=430679 RepID=A0ABW0T5V0_9HYPH|nr:ATP phosphoribosyltransferase regulatory subunit [Nitratireductor kimnyeongensis]QZZ34683.1 ATP phosphoribosyltransferase regulatory subunit [Nitratireductor kimnyeongensis]
MTLRAPDFAGDIFALFAEREAELTDIAIIQPADPFLDMAGEDLRRRIFLTESETGANLCLRPEFTIPVCRDHIEKRAATPQRYAYLGEVFRQQREGGAEFFQAGIEDLGASDRAGADARSLADAHALLTRVLPGHALSVTLGDQAVFEAVLSALGLPRGWQMRLTRAFGSQKLLQAALDDLANPQAAANLPRAIAGLVARGDEAALADHIATVMDETGISPSAGRAPQEIARRLIEKAELRSVRLTDEAMSALKAFVAMRTPLAEAEEQLSAFAAENGLILDDALETFSARAERISGEGLPLDALTYDAGFGRPLDYYTGFVFEIASPRGTVLAGGGRYDRLLTLLGAETPIPGVGFSIWLDRVADLKETAA